MKLSLLVSTSQINSKQGRIFGTGSVKGLRHLADIMVTCGIKGDIYDLPNGSRNTAIASPFSLNNGFALTTDELDILSIPELKHDPGFLSHLEKIQQTHGQIFFSSRTVSYTLRRSLVPWIMEKCFALFRNHQDNERQKEYETFQNVASYWLEHFSLYELYKELQIDLTNDAFRSIDSTEVQTLIKQHQERLSYHRYVQFLCFEQRKSAHAYLNTHQVGLIVNLPFGVEFDSADVYFHPEVFEEGIQVGCSPEPEHGYPEQAWGVAVYREKSPGLKRYLEAKMKWIALMGDGVFLDHLVGWCGQYVVPLVIDPDSSYPYGHFLTEDPDEREKNIRWFLEIIDQSGLKIRGEVAGDGPRVSATRSAIEKYKALGKNISAMSIPRWESDRGRLIPLADYSESTLMMVETHDTSTLLQYLLNRKGYQNDFETPERILEFSQRVLGLPFLSTEVPLKLKEGSQEFWVELFRRLTRSTPCEDLVFSLPGLISMLSPDYRSASIENNINVKPGTSGAVGNGWRNWSYFSPPIETMENDPALKEILTELGNRVYSPFEHFHHLELNNPSVEHLEIIYTNPKGRNIVFRDQDGLWKVIPLSQHSAESVISELIIGNTGTAEIWQRLDLSSIIDLGEPCEYCFQDLNARPECYRYQTETLKNDGFFIRLQPGQIHHFLVSRQEPVIVDFPE